MYEIVKFLGCCACNMETAVVRDQQGNPLQFETLQEAEEFIRVHDLTGFRIVKVIAVKE